MHAEQAFCVAVVYDQVCAETRHHRRAPRQQPRQHAEQRRRNRQRQRPYRHTRTHSCKHRARAQPFAAADRDHVAGSLRSIQRRQHGQREIVGMYRLAQTRALRQREHAPAHRLARDRGETLVHASAIDQRAAQQGPAQATAFAASTKTPLGRGQARDHHALGGIGRILLGQHAHRRHRDHPRLAAQRRLLQPIDERGQRAEADQRGRLLRQWRRVRQCAAQPVNAGAIDPRRPAQRAYRWAPRQQAR